MDFCHLVLIHRSTPKTKKYYWKQKKSTNKYGVQGLLFKLIPSSNARTHAKCENKNFELIYYFNNSFALNLATKKMDHRRQILFSYQPQTPLLLHSPEIQVSTYLEKDHNFLELS